MIKERIKRIYKLTILIAVRQIWKLAENLYRLVNQPFLTMKDLAKSKDKSQIFLITVTAVAPIIFYTVARLFWDFYRFKHILPAVGGFFKAVILIEAGVLLYLGYWMFQALRKRRIS